MRANKFKLFNFSYNITMMITTKKKKSQKKKTKKVIFYYEIINIY